MRLGVFAFFLLLTGIFIPEIEVNAGVIRSSDKRESNYAIHQRIIIYTKLSSYQNSDPNTYKYDLGLVGRQDSIRNISNTLYLQSQTSPGFAKPDRSLLAHGITSRNQDYSDILTAPVGFFLEDFKNDPILKTIYFSSKDLIFSYQKKTANILQLGFDMDSDEKKQFKGPGRNALRIQERALTQRDKQRLKQENRSLFSQLSESYKTIIYVILAIFGTIYLSFRYVLNKYI